MVRRFHQQGDSAEQLPPSAAELSATKEEKPMLILSLISKLLHWASGGNECTSLSVLSVARVMTAQWRE